MQQDHPVQQADTHSLADRLGRQELTVWQISMTKNGAVYGSDLRSLRAAVNAVEHHHEGGQDTSGVR